MKRYILYLFIMIVFCTAACKSKDSKVDSADSGQVHVGGSTAADSSRYPATPTETGGQDTSGNGTGTTNAPKDTLKKNP